MSAPTVTIERIEEDDAAEGFPRRILLLTVAILLPAEFNDADIADITPVAVKVEGYADDDLTDFIQTTVQEARLVMA